MRTLTTLKAERMARTKGIKGWAAVAVFLGIMCADQFVLDIPFENVVFPLLIIAAACMSPAKNLALILAYSVVFELSCIAWNPWDLMNAPLWLLEVVIGFSMPFLVYKAINGKHRDMSVFSYAALASLGQLLYFWVSVAATALIWKVDLAAYFASDLIFELAGCAVTFVCALPVAALYKLTTGELSLRGRRTAALPL